MTVNLDHLRRALEKLVADAPSLHLDEFVPGSDWTGTQFVLRLRNQRSTTILKAFVTPEEVEVFFGEGLSAIYGFTESSRPVSDVADVLSLLEAVVFQGYTETVWRRNNEVVKAEAQVVIAGEQKVFRAHRLVRPGSSKREQIVHPPVVENGLLRS